MGHPISSDNGLISLKLLLKPEFYYPVHVTMGVAYSCLKYLVVTRSDLMLYLVYNTVRVFDHEKSHFNEFLLGVELVKDAICLFGKLY